MHVFPSFCVVLFNGDSSDKSRKAVMQNRHPSPNNNLLKVIMIAFKLNSFTGMENPKKLEFTLTPMGHRLF